MTKNKPMKRAAATSVKKNDPIHVYYDMIKQKKVTVSRKVRLVYKELCRIMDRKRGKWIYDPAKAELAIDFIQIFCRQSKGQFGGKKLMLEPWQKALIAATFGIVNRKTGLRKYTTVMLNVARKNGKSTLASAVGLYMMIADGESGPEVYACATKKDQAKIIWSEAKKMVEKSPSLRKRIKTKVAELESSLNDSTFKFLGSDSDTQDGLNVSCALLDEIHAWKTVELYDVIVDGEASREQPLTFITTTAGTVRESIYDRMYDHATDVINGFEDPLGVKDEHYLPIIYELDKREEWTEEKNWYKANPGLGTIKNINTLRDKVEKAKLNSMLVRNLLCKDFDIRQTTNEAWLTFEEFNNTEKFDIEALKPSYGIGGVDLSATTDLTAAKIIFKIPDDPKIYVISKYWLPEDKLEQHVKEDKIPYDLWAEKGYVDIVPGGRIHHKFITAWFREIYEKYDLYPYFVGYDSWAAEYWVEDMSNNFGKENMVPVIQGKKTLSVPMYNLQAEFNSKNIVYNNNPIDKWCFSNTSVDIDRNNNIQPAKGRAQTRRIDGTAALLDAYTVLYNREDEYMSMIA